MRCGAALLLALVALRAEAQRVEDEYEEALQDEARGTTCEDDDCARCPPPPANCSFLVSSGLKYFYNVDAVSSGLKYFYKVDGVKLKIELWLWHVMLTCPPGVTLESESLPVFPTPMRVSRVTLNACPAPRAAGGIRRALSHLNITEKLGALTLNDLPPAPRLQPDLFADLQDLEELHLSAKAGQQLEPPPGLLEPLKKLESLYLTNVMSPASLDRLPPPLVRLTLEQRLPVEGSAPAVRSMDLENVLLTTARNSLSALLVLRVRVSQSSSPRGTAPAPVLPMGWLQVRGKPRCPRLYELRLNSCALGGLPADALHGLTQLHDLTVTECRELRALPRELFNDTRFLRQLVLANNALEMLPEGIFAPLRDLNELDLSGNMLGTLGDGVAALAGLRSLTSLQVLVLDHNPLGDTCGHSYRDDTHTDYELSPLHELRQLRNLSLAHTGASRLCRDWRRELHYLNVINFSYNNITVLKYSDMRWYGRRRVVARHELRLAGVHLASLPNALPASLRVLDLRNASLPAATERQAAALFADARDVLLGGARVACACAAGARPALARLLVTRLQDVRCAEDGRRASDMPPCPVIAERELEPLRGAWAGALGRLVVAALVQAAQRVTKVFLHAPRRRLPAPDVRIMRLKKEYRV